jgi:hypothetical protein
MTVRGKTALRISAQAALYLALGLAAGGCYAIGAVAHVAFGAPDVDAKFVPPKQSTLVLVENYQDQDAGSADGDTVARSVGEKLHEHAELEVIDPDKVAPLRTEQAAAFHEMSIPAVGRAVGAKQVVYVNLVESEKTADPTGAAVNATALARVKVVDADTGAVLWPKGQPKGWEISATMPYDRSDSTQGQTMKGEMLSQLSDEISKLFYKWKPDTEQESNDASGT